ASREAYVVEVAAICTTQAAQLAEVDVPTEGTLDQVATENRAAAAILEQTVEDLKALDPPRSTDTTAYLDFRRQLISLAHTAEDSAEAATTVDSTRLAELTAEYDELRQTMTGGPAESGLEECLASLPS
ncbi:MAG TPA: hypothetical protein VMS92_10940, partial [Mycobacterium sp.]|nr:hypothetical protein [Mycobacterium sp.]